MKGEFVHSRDLMSGLIGKIGSTIRQGIRHCRPLHDSNLNRGIIPIY